MGLYSLVTNLLFLDVVYFITPLPSAPCPPQTLSSTIEQYGQDNVTLTVQWSSQCDGGAPVNYSIAVSPGLNAFTTSGATVPVTVSYNEEHTVSIVASNCIGSSSAAVETIRIGISLYINCMYACVEVLQVLPEVLPET